MSRNKVKDADRRKWFVLTVVVLKLMMDGMDGSMLNIALPSISQSLGVASGAVIWIVSVYSIFANASRTIIIPFYMQGVLNMPVQITGLYMAITPVITLFVSPVSGIKL